MENEEEGSEYIIDIAQEGMGEEAEIVDFWET